MHQLRDDEVVKVSYLFQREDLLNTLDGAHCNVNSLQPCNVLWDLQSIVLTARALVRLLPPLNISRNFLERKI